MKKLEDYNKELKDIINDGGQYMLFFTADWCADCRFIKPRMPEIEAEYPEYEWIEVDRDKYMDIAKDLRIMGIPSFVSYKDGKETGRFVSSDRKTKDQIEDFVDSISA